MSNALTASRYARALLESASDSNVLPQVTADMKLLETCMQNNKSVFATFCSPAIQKNERTYMAIQAFENSFHELSMRFLQVLLLRGRHGLLAYIPHAFMELADKHNQCMRGQVVSAKPLNDEERQELKSRLEKRTGRRCELEYSIDAGLRSGFRLRIADNLIDCSSAGALSRLRSLLLKTE
jgi:F-type H+-transporting ATPase subunit delta